MKNVNPLGLFDDHFLLDKLTKLGDPLERLNDYIDWNIFKSPLDSAFRKELKDSSKGGRPSFDKLLMFKSLIIQSLCNLSDDQLEYQIVDRSSFKRFLGLKKNDKVPDSKTFWYFREQLTEKDFILALFKIFNETLDSTGVFANEGKMVDASFVEAPANVIQRKKTSTSNRQVQHPGNGTKPPINSARRTWMPVGQRKTM